MYAVVKTGGKQYRVSPGDTIQVEKIDGQPGESLELSDVLLVSDGEAVTLGRPVVDGAAVSAEIVGQGRHRKVVIFKYKRRKRYRRKRGHRQAFTTLKITDIRAAAGVAQPAAPPPPPAPPPVPVDA